ncbi:hypothetical protein M426DRAFT_325252 [Hypoxylon sp. CI-4A]|nr:hypothetical protein M426DRAFT_325252 [Hypoxylon sp. CI-4A]
MQGKLVWFVVYDEVIKSTEVTDSTDGFIWILISTLATVSSMQCMLGMTKTKRRFKRRSEMGSGFAK